MQRVTLWLRLFSLIGICLVAFLAAALVQATTKRVSTPTTAQVSHLRADATPQPTSQSLLVVLLDRSSSLYETDPEQYSTSMAKILTDLWPGKMAVIFFNDIHSPFY